MTDYRPWQPPAPQDPPRTVWPTARQIDVLHGICLGLTDQQIGRRLGLAEDTVGTHVRRLYRTTCVHSRAELVALIYSRAIRVMEPHDTWRQP